MKDQAAATIETMKPGPSGLHGYNVPITMKENQKALIKIVFRVKDPNKEAKVSIKFEAKGVDAMVEDCMSVKSCLADLGDGSEAGFLLRNNNMYQLICLLGETSKLPKDVQALCVVWEACMSHERALKLLTFLKAAQGKKGGGSKSGSGAGGGGHKNSLGELANARHNVQAVSHEDPPVLCTDPEVDDPEAWECACLPEMIEICRSRGSTDPEVDDNCFRELMCQNEDVCERWKKEHCTPDEQKAKQSSSMMTQRAAGNTSSDGGMAMESSLSGKCAG